MASFASAGRGRLGINGHTPPHKEGITRLQTTVPREMYIFQVSRHERKFQDILKNGFEHLCWLAGSMNRSPLIKPLNKKLGREDKNRVLPQFCSVNSEAGNGFV